jgi:hypothetical protein
MLSCHDDGFLSLKYLPEGRTKELDTMMSPSYFKPEPQLMCTDLPDDQTINQMSIEAGVPLKKKLTYRHSSQKVEEKVESNPISTLIRVSQKYLTF